MCSSREGELTPSTHCETIIIGAGIAGLACARSLFEAQRPFLVIAENVGGRIRRSDDGAVNLGAYYVRADYTHVNRYVELGRRFGTMAVRRHDAEDSYTFWDRRLVLHGLQAARFVKLLLRFRRHYRIVSRRVLTVGQAAAIRSDPLLYSLYRQPALEFILEHRLEHVARSYVAPAIHGTTFSSLADISAFTMLLGALPLLEPTYEFTFQLDRILDGFADSIVVDSVIGIEVHGSGYLAETVRSGTFSGEHIVVATPSGVAARLLGLPSIKQPVISHMWEVAGVLRSRYARADMHLFPEADPILAITVGADGNVLVASRDGQPDLDRIFETWRVVEHRRWYPAFHIVGTELLECEQGPNLFLIGDHNIVGLEDAYLTGLYAANQIAASGPVCSFTPNHRRRGRSALAVLSCGLLRSIQGPVDVWPGPMKPHGGDACDPLL